MLLMSQFLAAACPRIDITDVGAMILDEAESSYARITAAGIANVIGFEPNQAECDKLNALAQRNHRFLPYCIGDGNEAEFKLCAAPMTSSLLEPNLPLLRKFNQLAEFTTPVSRTRVQTHRLDDIDEITGIDFLKLDTQGAELDILRNAQRLLKNTVVVQTEVEFVHLYVNQPLFADIDAEMRRQGFCLHILGQPNGRCFKPILLNEDPAARLNQALWADAVYIKDFMHLSALSPTQLLKMALLVSDLYASLDLAALCLQHYDHQTGHSLWPAYMQRLAGAVPPAPPLD